MKVKYVILVRLFCLLWAAQGYGQNLVPNPSFEQLDFCPFQINQIHAATGWQNWRESPELFNTCAVGGLNIPYTGFGYQTAHLGNSMAGLLTYINPNGPAGPNRREYIASQLISPLIIGQKYYVSFFANLANFNGYCMPTNNLGALFSTVNFDQNNPQSITDFAHVNYTQIIYDTLNWSYCSGSFIADSTYNYICLGNFFHDSLTTIDSMNTPPYAGYYFIDDICVSTDSNYASTWTGIERPNQRFSTLHIYPNPVHSNINIIGLKSKDQVKIYDANGKLMTNYFQINKNVYDISQLTSGVYFLYIISEQNVKSYKIIINH